ncbi:hypothetical protein AVEN_82119-1 [Araneus ventricosus]|uniref:Uncharacterized protein n=1 Tax=Araneus ventricosus TaxID=182803 RepID=A0A4Y2I3E8_ARAVE|nr:hypothetical protein AVEN_82119-1 [Araneus ventricosus]
MTSLPVQEKNTLLSISTAMYAQFKADVQSVRRACRGRLEHAVEWLSSHVEASRGPPKYKQHADEQLSPFVLSLRLGRGGFGSMAATFARSYTVGFFPMGHLKELVYRDVLTTQMDLVARRHAACTSVDPAMLQRVMTAIPRRAQACLEMHGGHFEHLL